MKWLPITTTEQMLPTEKLIVKLVKQACRHATKAKPTLFDGSLGVLVLLNTLKTSNPQLFDEQQFSHLEDQFFDSAADFPYQLSLCSGLAGLGFGLDYLGLNDDFDNNDDVNSCLLEHLQSDHCNNDFDYLYGITGIGLYGICRKDKNSGTELFKLVLHRLEQSQTTTDNGTYWATEKDHVSYKDEFGKGQINLGVAHGNLGIAGLLVKAIEQNVEVERCLSLLEPLCKQLVSEMHFTGTKSYLPTMVNVQDKDKSIINSRMGWCYGDLAASVILLRAARVLKDQKLETIAVEMGLKSALMDESTGGIRDAGLCHGSTGCSLIFQRLYNLTDNETFKLAAQKWLAHTLALAEADPSFNNMMCTFEKNKDENVALLDGYVGICLSLIASISPVEPHWDASFLLS